jgi:VWFA-related protein
MLRKSRLKAGCSQDWLPHKTAQPHYHAKRYTASRRLRRNGGAVVRDQILCTTPMRCCLLLLAAAGPSPAILNPQQPVSDEIRVGSQPYVSQSPYTIRVETKLVDLVVAVRDGHGRAIPGLKKGDFQIYDDGKERAIATFSEDKATAGSGESVPPSATAPVGGPAAKPGETQPARFLALFFDDVNAKDGLAGGDLGRAQAAAKRFMKDALQPGVRIGIFTVSGKQTLDFTADASKLTGTIAALSPHMRISGNGIAPCPRITPYRAYKIAQFHDRETMNIVLAEAAMANCYGATRQYIEDMAEETWRRVKEISLDTLVSIGRVVEYLGKMPGTRVLLMASSGFFGETLEPQQDKIIGEAVHAGVVINALDAKGLYSEPLPNSRPGDPRAYKGGGSTTTLVHETMNLEDRLTVVNSAMADLARGTGGVFFHDNNDLNAGFHQLGLPPEVTYRMSFSPEGAIADGSYHKLKVKLIHSGSYSVEARPGYFAPEKTAAATENPQSKIDREVMASDTLTGVPAGLSIQVGKPSASQRTLAVIVHLDISKLAFSKQNDRKTQRITFVTALLDSQGKMVAAKEGRMDLALKEATYGQLVRAGVNAKLTFEMPPGVYSLREVVAEAVGGNLSSSTNSVDLR